jgi:hypothetical protein
VGTARLPPCGLATPLQFYCNGHNWLARQLDRKKIGYKLLDNAFAAVQDWVAAQEISNQWDAARLHRKLDEFADHYCPILKQIEETYHWSLEEAEYATDIVFHRQADLQTIYGNLIRTAIHTVKPDDIATFLGKKLNGNYQDEMGNRYNVRIEGTRVRHSMGMVSIKMYDKFGQILRIEATTKDVSFFKHYREVEQRNGEAVMKFAPLKKTIYSLGPLRELLSAANRRHLEFLSAIDDPSNGIHKLNRITAPVHEDARSYRGFNFFDNQCALHLVAPAAGPVGAAPGALPNARLCDTPHHGGRPARSAAISISVRQPCGIRSSVRQK